MISWILEKMAEAIVISTESDADDLSNAPINDLPHSPPCGQHTGFTWGLPEIIAQTKGDLPFPNGAS